MNTRTVPHSQKLAGVAFAVCLFWSLPAQADTVNWGTATDTTSASDVSLNGTLVAGFNGGGSDTTVSGVLFSAADLLTGSTIGAGLLAGADTGDAAFNVLLDEVDFGGGGATTTLDPGSFTSGNTYEVQIFFTDQRTGQRTRVMTYGSSDSNGAGSTVDLAADPNQDFAAPYGQFVIGTFTADGDDPDLTLTPNGFGNSHFSGIQIRDITTAVPEPSTLALLSFGIVGLISRRRRN